MGPPSTLIIARASSILDNEEPAPDTISVAGTVSDPPRDLMQTVAEHRGVDFVISNCAIRIGVARKQGFNVGAGIVVNRMTYPFIVDENSDRRSLFSSTING